MFVSGKPIRPPDTPTALVHQKKVKDALQKQYGDKVTVEFDSIYAGEGTFTILIDDSCKETIEDITDYVERIMKKYGAKDIQIG